MALDERLNEINSRQYELRAMQDELRQSFGGTGGGSLGGMTEDWKASVDKQLDRLHSDVRNLLYGLIGAAVFLLGAGWVAYSQLNAQVADLRVGVERVSGRLDTVTARVEGIEKKIDGIDGKLDRALEAK